MNRPHLIHSQSTRGGSGHGGAPTGYGGGGNDGGMDARVTTLEEIARDTRGTLESINRQLARIDTKLDSKPDQGWIITLVCAVFGVVLAAVVAGASIFAAIK